MKKIILSISFICFLSILFGQTNPSTVQVKTYVKKDGAVVQSHTRTSPNTTIRDNYSTKPNVNPNTGKVGTVTSGRYRRL